MFSDPQFWVAVSFFLFIAVIFNPVRKILISSLDSQISEIKSKISEAENLKNTSIEWHNDKSLCIVMCSKGYPDKYKNNVELNLNNLKLGKSEFLFHAGTKLINGKTYSNGGRVLNIVVKSNFFKSARDKALSLLTKLNWENGFYRKDIGHKVVDQ